MTNTQTADSEDIMLTLTAAAAVLGVSRSTVYRIVKDGGLPTQQLRKTSRVRLADVEKLKEESWSTSPK